MFMLQLVSITEGAGGLFDFNATLPLMGLQFILLTVVLTFVFYKPVGKVLEEREAFINDNLVQASTKLLTADELYKEYDEKLKTARSNASEIVTKAESEAKSIVEGELAQARKDAANLIDKTNKDLEAQKVVALEKLDTQIDGLSQLIKEKLIGEKVA
jgi:F-type H+-transporting ATPase subunit b